MTDPKPAPNPAPFRVRVIQDVPVTGQQQVDLLHREAKRRNLALSAERIELRMPASKIIAQINKPGVGIDWIVVDLLISPIEDHSVLTSAGLNLLRQFAKSGFFHGYQPRSPANAGGVRCIAIYSASLANYGGHAAAINRELTELGIDQRYRYVPGTMRELATDVCDEVQRSGAPGWV